MWTEMWPPYWCTDFQAVISNCFRTITILNNVSLPHTNTHIHIYPHTRRQLKIAIYDVLDPLDSKYPDIKVMISHFYENIIFSMRKPKIETKSLKGLSRRAKKIGPTRTFPAPMVGMMFRLPRQPSTHSVHRLLYEIWLPPDVSASVLLPWRLLRRHDTLRPSTFSCEPCNLKLPVQLSSTFP